jgi:hypothetical protein
MSDNQDNLDYRVQIESIILAVANKMDERLNEYEARIDQIEKQIATIVVGFGEQAVFMEALVGQIAFASKEAQDAFQEQLTKGRKQMLEVMNDASAGFVADQDPGLGKAIGDLAKEKLSNTDQ